MSERGVGAEPTADAGGVETGAPAGVPEWRLMKVWVGVEAEPGRETRERVKKPGWGAKQKKNEISKAPSDKDVVTRERSK